MCPQQMHRFIKVILKHYEINFSSQHIGLINGHHDGFGGLKNTTNVPTWTSNFWDISSSFTTFELENVNVKVKF